MKRKQAPANLQSRKQDITVHVHGITVTTKAPKFKSALIEADALLKRIGAKS